MRLPCAAGTSGSPQRRPKPSAFGMMRSRSLIGHEPDEATGRRSEWRPVVVLRNAAPRARGGVAMIDLREFIADEAVGPGSRPPASEGGVQVPWLPPRLPSIGVGRALQLLDQRVGRDRIESARHYPDNDIVRVSHVAAWVDPVPPLGLACLPDLRIAASRRAIIPNRVRTGRTSLDNGLVALDVDDDGVLSPA